MEPLKLTTELLDQIIDKLIQGRIDEVDDAAIQFLKDKKDVLAGMAADPLIALLEKLGSDTPNDRLQVQTDLVNSFPTAAMVNRFYNESVTSLEQSVEEPMRLGAFMRGLANYATGIVPRFLPILTALI